MAILSETDLIKFSYQKGEDNFSGRFIIEPLLPGYGFTLGHALRRVLLSSLPGAAVCSAKIEGVSHEFSTLKGMKEDIIDLIFNLKNLRFRLEGDEPTVIKLEKKGAAVVRAKDFQSNPLVKFVDPQHYLATLDKNGKLIMEVNVKKGRGYEPTEQRKDEKLPLGTIAIDSIFTPVKKINYEVENTRVGGITNFDKLMIDITTDGSITPEEVFKTANQILIDHFSLISQRISAQETKKKEKRSPKEKKAPSKKSKKEIIKKSSKKARK